MKGYNIKSNLNNYAGSNNYSVPIGTTRNIKGSSNRIYQYCRRHSETPLYCMFQFPPPSASPTPPSVPSAPMITSVIPTSITLSINFTPPTSDGGSPITNYEYSLNGSPFTLAGTTASPINVTGLTPGTTYDVVIRAVNSVGNSPNSNSVNVTTFLPTTPSAPTITSVIPTSTTLSINFTPPTSDGGSPITNYEYSLNGSPFTLAGTTATPIIVTGLTPDTIYNNVVIRAVNSVGNSPNSNSVNVTTLKIWAPFIENLTIFPATTTASVNEILFDAINNSFYIGGNFSTIGDISANRIAKFNRNNNTWSRLGTLTYNGIYLAQNAGDTSINKIILDSNNNLIVAGAFNNAGDISANNIAIWNGTSWSSIGTDAINNGFNSYVRDIVIGPDNNLYACGNFILANYNRPSNTGITANRIAKWDGSVWSSTFGTGLTAPSGFIPTCIRLIFDSIGNLYASGTFDTIGDISANNIAMWNGTNWSRLGTNASNNGINSGGASRSLAVDSNNNIYVGGSFTRANATTIGSLGGGIIANRIAKWNPTDASWNFLGTAALNGFSGTSSRCASIIFDSFGDIYAGGICNTAGDISANNIAMWNGTNWSRLGTFTNNGTNGTVNVQYLDSSGNIYIGGTFTAVNSTLSTSIGTGISAKCIAIYNRLGISL